MVNLLHTLNQIPRLDGKNLFHEDIIAYNLITNN